MNYIIFDARGLLLHSYHRSQRKTIETPDGFIPSWEDGLAEFITEYLDPTFRQVAPRQVIACFDGGNTARRALYHGYKAKRKQRDHEEDATRSEQIKLLMEHGQRLLAYLGCRTVRVTGEEADDLIGLFCERLEADAITVYTRDKDLLQLVNDKVAVYQNGTLYATNYGETSLNGVPFDLIALMKAIVGDSSDEYPGIKGCGPKFFDELLSLYGADGLRQLKTVIEGWNYPKGTVPSKTSCKLMEKLIANWDDLLLYYKVAKINPNFCYGAANSKRKVPEWYVRVPSQKVVTEILVKVGLPRPEWLRFFPTENLIDATRANDLQQLAQEIFKSPVVSYDFETSDKRKHPPFLEYDKGFVDVLSQELTSLSINYGDNLQHTLYIPFDHAATANLNLDWARWILQVLAAVQPRAVVQNAAFELTVALKQVGEAPKAPFDTAIMAMYVDENEENGLKALSKRWLNYTQTTYKEVTNGRSMHELTALEALSYGCDDSLVTSHLFDVFKHIMQLEGMWQFYAENEVDWALDAAHYFVDGTDVDYATLHTFYEEAKKRVTAGMEAIHTALSQHCNASKTAEVVQPLAMTLFDEWWQLESERYPEQEKAEAARQRLWEQAWNGCFYTSPTSSIEVKFAPTPTQLNAVALLADKALPRIDKVTQKFLEEWDIAASDALEEASRVRVVSDQTREFVNALYHARKSLKKPETPEYQALHDLCINILKSSGKVKILSAGDQLNTNSTKQMQQLLYGKLELPIRRRSKVAFGSSRAKLGIEGGPATGIKAIQAAKVYDVIEASDWRNTVLDSYYDVAKTSQEISLYYETYPLLVHPATGKIHPHIRNCGTVTRRPSGSAPNVLQVAKGPLRTLFRAGDYGDGERVVVSADFSSQELQILACESKDPVMLQAFTSTPRLDLHAMTASGFAHIVMSRLGIAISEPPDYNTFYGWLHQTENPELAKAAKTTRNKYAKACIAEGSLVLTNKGLVPIEKVTLAHRVWDGVEWVEHDGVIFNGIREVITYDGLTATPDHEVYLHDGRKIRFGDYSLEQERPKLAVGENNGAPVGFIGNNLWDILCNEPKWKNLRESFREVYSMWQGINATCGQPSRRENKKLPVSESADTLQGSTGASHSGQVPRDTSAVYKSAVAKLQKLWWTWNQVFIRLLPRVCGVGDGEFTTPYLQKCGTGQNRQQRSLRAWEFATGAEENKLGELSEYPHGHLFGSNYATNSCLARNKVSAPRISVCSGHSNPLLGNKQESGQHPSIPETNKRWAKVYDIVNAGHRHRFTVSGKVVANCNFGIAYKAGPTTLAENLLIPVEFAKELMSGVFNLYRRIQPWQEEMTEFAKRNGYTITAYGNRRHAPSDLWSSENGLVSRASRQLINAVIQSTAADILKVVLTEMTRREMRQRYRLKALRPVYDEITASVPADLAVDYALELVEVMSVTPPGYPVGMGVDVSIGTTWGSVQEVGGTDRTTDRNAERTALETTLNKVLTCTTI